MVALWWQSRVFHTTMGHHETALESVGFILSFTRGAEWAASGRVTQAIPKDFPSAEKSSQRAYPSLAEHAPKVKEKQ